jgi:hypothetical protein
VFSSAGPMSPTREGLMSLIPLITYALLGGSYRIIDHAQSNLISANRRSSMAVRDLRPRRSTVTRQLSFLSGTTASDVRRTGAALPRSDGSNSNRR